MENIDATVIAQRPKLAAYLPQMRENLARVLGLERSQVSVKATTEEGLGFTGSGEGIAVQAVCLIESLRSGSETAGSCGGCCGRREDRFQ